MDPEYDNCCPAKMSMTTQAFIEGARKKTGRGRKAKVKAKPKPKPRPGEGPTIAAARIWTGEEDDCRATATDMSRGK